MHNTVHIVRVILFALLMVAGVCKSVIAAPRLYDVEVIIFSHNSSSQQGEDWRAPGRNTGNASGQFPANQFTELSSSRYRLNPVRYSLRNSSDYAVLFHRAWRQVAYSPANAVDYPVHSFSDDSSNSVEGTIRLDRGRYLHLNLDLLLMKSAGRAPGYYSDGPGNIPAFHLSEKRRIKSSELHYFDHPQFGILALVTPYSRPVQVAPEPSSPGPGSPSDEAPVPAKAPASQQ